MTIYVVTVQNFNDGKKKVSSEGYTNREDAVRFIKGRTDYKEKGFQFNEFRFITNTHIYEICDINI